jgi:hypothetical protein
MKLICTVLLFSALLACNFQTTDTGKEASPQPDSKASSIHCYKYSSEADTITLKVIHAGDSIAGTLVYNLKEKDRNEGTIKGSMKGDVLLADYTFMSEGVQSTRQVAFKLQGDTFVEGYGDSVEQNGEIKFKNLDSLTFSSSIKLSEVACE